MSDSKEGRELDLVASLPGSVGNVQDSLATSSGGIAANGNSALAASGGASGADGTGGGAGESASPLRPTSDGRLPPLNKTNSWLEREGAKAAEGDTPGGAAADDGGGGGTTGGEEDTPEDGDDGGAAAAAGGDAASEEGGGKDGGDESDDDKRTPRASTSEPRNQLPGWRVAVRHFIMHKYADRFIIGCICANTLVLCSWDPLNTDPSYTDAFDAIDLVFQLIYTIEMVLKIIGLGLLRKPDGYMRDAWNNLDGFLVIVGWLPYLQFDAGFNMTTLRAVRILRPLRTVSSIPGLKNLISSMLASIPQLMNVMGVLVFLFCLFGLVGLQMLMGKLSQRCHFVDADGQPTVVNEDDEALCGLPGEGVGRECPVLEDGTVTVCADSDVSFNDGISNFDDIGYAVLTTFQLMSMEGWTDIMYATRESAGSFFDIYFVMLIAVGSLFVLNLVVSVLTLNLGAERRMGELLREKAARWARMAKGSASASLLSSSSGKKGAAEAFSYVLALMYTNAAAEADGADTKTGADSGAKDDKSRGKGLTIKTDDASLAPAEHMDIQQFDFLMPKRGEPLSPTRAKIAEFRPRKDSTPLRVMVFRLVHKNWFSASIVGAIVINTITLGLEHHQQPQTWTDTLEIINAILTIIFAVEMVLKLYGLTPRGYISDRFNCFDGTIVLISALEYALASDGGNSGLSVLRSFRLLRVLKLARSWTSLNELIRTIMRTIPRIGPFSIVLLLFMVVYTLVGVQIFGGKFGSPPPRANYDSFLWGFTTTFQVLTLEDWNAVMYHAMNTVGPASALYFVLLVVLGSYMVLNLFLAILIDNFCNADEDDAKEEEAARAALEAALAESNAPVTPGGSKAQTTPGGTRVAPEKPSLTEQLEEATATAEATEESKDTPHVGPPPGEANSVRKPRPRRSRVSAAASTQLIYATGSAVPEMAQLKRRSSVGELEANQATAEVAQEVAIPVAEAGATDGTDGGSLEEKRSVRGQTVMKALNESRLLKAYAQQRAETGVDATTVDDLDIDKLIPPSERDDVSHLPHAVQMQYLGYLKRQALSVITKANRTRAEIERKRARDFKHHKSYSHKAFYVLPGDNPLRRFMGWLVLQPPFDAFILFLIAVSCVLLALDSPNASEGLKSVLADLDVVMTILFTLELVFKWIAFGVMLHPGAYLTDSWNWLDFVIVIASLVDLALGGTASFVKVIRFFRALRPLRAVKRLEGLRVVVNAVLKSVPYCFNVAMLLVLFFFLFGVLGVNFFGGRFYSCTDTSKPCYRPWADDCPAELSCEGSWTNPDTGELEEREWRNPSHGSTEGAGRYSFDNSAVAVLTLFEVSSLELWVNVMVMAADVTKVGWQPEPNASEWAVFVFISFVVIASFFMLNLFVSVVIDNFKKMKAQLATEGSVFMTETQQRWVEMQRVIKRKPPEMMMPPLQNNRLRVWAFDIIQMPKFEGFIMGCIIANVIVMAMTFKDEPQYWTDTLEGVNLLFGFIFICEAVMKIAGLGVVQYFKFNWNRFDFSIVALNLVTQIAAWTVGALDIGFDLNTLRVIRVVRIFRLVKTSQQLRSIAMTLIFSLPALANVGAIMLLVLFMYSVAGMALFGTAPHGDFVNEHANFESFGSAMITLFRCSTGESWNGIMHDVSIEAGSAAATAFFVSFLVLGQFMMLNLLVAIILENFEREMDEDMDDVTPTDVENFTDAWEAIQRDDTNRMARQQRRLTARAKSATRSVGDLSKASSEAADEEEDDVAPSAVWGGQASGIKLESEWMRIERFQELIDSLQPPLGLEPEYKGFRGVFLRMMRGLDIPVSKTGKVSYTHTLRALVRRSCGENLPSDLEEAMNNNLDHKLQAGFAGEVLSEFTVSHYYAAQGLQMRARGEVWNEAPLDIVAAFEKRLDEMGMEYVSG